MGIPYNSTTTGCEAHGNADGSIDLHFGPNATAGIEVSEIPTIPGNGWFSLGTLAEGNLPHPIDFDHPPLTR